MTSRQRAYALAAERKMTITENSEGRGVTVRIEAPHDSNFGSEHEVVSHWHSGTNWKSIIDDVNVLPVYPCDADCDGWDGVHCDWWRPETESN